MITESLPQLQRANVGQQPAPPPVVAHTLDADLHPDAFQTFDANNVMLESGVAQKSKVTHARGTVAKVVVGQAIYDAIEARVAELKETFARHDQFDKDSLAAAKAKRVWKARCRVIRREMLQHRHLLTAMAKYIGKVPIVPREVGDDYDGRAAAYAEHFGNAKTVESFSVQVAV